MVPDPVGSEVFVLQEVADSLGYCEAHYSVEVASFAHFRILTAAHLTSLVAVLVTPLLSRTARIFPRLG